MPYLEIDGWQVWYESFGSGPSLILLHHWHGTGATCWRPVIPYLAQRFRVIVPDLRGHGHTPNPGPAPISPRSVAGDAAALLDALGLQEAHWAGSSFGGHALLWLALEQPSRILSLCTVAAPYALAPQTRAMMRQSGVHPSAAFIKETGERHPAMGPNGWRWFASEAMRQAEMHDDADVALGELAALRAPALIIGSDNDRFTPLAQTVALHGAIAGARLLVLPKGGHWPHRVYPEFVAARLIENALGPP